MFSIFNLLFVSFSCIKNHSGLEIIKTFSSMPFKILNAFIIQMLNITSELIKSFESIKYLRKTVTKEEINLYKVIKRHYWESV